MKANEAPEKIYVEIKHPFSEEYTEMIAFEDGDGIEYTRTDAFIKKAESVCAEMFLRVESELFNAGVKNTNNRKEIEDALEIGYKYFKKTMKGE